MHSASCLAVTTLVLVVGCESSSTQPPPAEAEPLPEVEYTGPSAPAAAGPNAIAFDLRGRINSYEQAGDSMHAEHAWGDFLIYRDGIPCDLSDYPIAYVYHYPDDHPSESLRGRGLLVLQAYREDPASTRAIYRAQLAQVIVDQHLLPTLASGESFELTEDEIEVASIREHSAVSREDGVSLVKICYQALLDTESESWLRLSAPEGTEFAAGDGIQARAALAMTTDTDRIGAALSPSYALHQGHYCACTVQDQPVACDEWEQEAARDVTGLSCELPQEFLTPASDSFVTLKFKGTIYGEGDVAVPGYATVIAATDGQPRGLEYSTTAVRTTIREGTYAGKEVIGLTSMGGVEVLSTTHYRYNALMIYVFVDTLLAMKQSGDHTVVVSPDRLAFANLYEADQVDDGTDSWIRLCPVGAMNIGAKDSELFACYGDSTSFGVGETLELAANLELETNPLLIGAGQCACLLNGAQASCALFPEEQAR